MEVSDIKNLRGIIGKHIYNKSYENDGVEEIELIVASSIGADLAMAFLTEAKMPVSVFGRKLYNFYRSTDM